MRGEGLQQSAQDSVNHGRKVHPHIHIRVHAQSYCVENSQADINTELKIDVVLLSLTTCRLNPRGLRWGP